MSNKSDFLEFGFGENDESVGGKKFKRFKGKEGEKYRLSFAWWPLNPKGLLNLDAKSPKFVGVNRHYIQGVGYVLDKGPELAKIAGGPAKGTVGSIIASWKVDKDGRLDKARLEEVDILPWIFSSQVYDILKTRHEEWPFGTYDLNVTCTETQYQKMDYSPARESLLRKIMDSEKSTALQQRIVAEVGGIAENLKGMLAQDMSIEKIREKLGGPAAGGNFSPAATQEVDGLLDDLLPGE